MESIIECWAELIFILGPLIVYTDYTFVIALPVCLIVLGYFSAKGKDGASCATVALVVIAFLPLFPVMIVLLFPLAVLVGVLYLFYLFGKVCGG